MVAIAFATIEGAKMLPFGVHMVRYARFGHVHVLRAPPLRVKFMN